MTQAAKPATGGRRKLPIQMDDFPRRHPSIEPTHPGEILRDTVLPALGLSVSGAAEKLGITRQTLHRVLAGTNAVTPEMALRLGKLCGNGPGLWIGLQQERDLWHAQRAIAGELDRIPTLKAVAA